MPSYFVAITFSALSLTAAQAAPSAELAVAMQAVESKPGADGVKTSLARSQPVIGSPRASSSRRKAADASARRPPAAAREVSMEMVLAAVALMLVISLRRLNSGPR